MKGNKYLQQTQGFLSLSRNTHRTRTWPSFKPHNFASSKGCTPAFSGNQMDLYLLPSHSVPQNDISSRNPSASPLPHTGSLPLPMNSQKNRAGMGWDTEEEDWTCLGPEQWHRKFLYRFLSWRNHFSIQRDILSIHYCLQENSSTRNYSSFTFRLKVP